MIALEFLAAYFGKIIIDLIVLLLFWHILIRYVFKLTWTDVFDSIRNYHK